MTDAYETLGVRRDASLDEIRISYRRSVQVLQPERFASASEAIQMEAARRLSELTAAMETIEAARSGETSGTGALGPVPFGGTAGPAVLPPPRPAGAPLQAAITRERPAAPSNGAAHVPAPPPPLAEPESEPEAVEDVIELEPEDVVEVEDEPAPPLPSVFDVDSVPTEDEAADPTLAAPEPPIAAPPPSAPIPYERTERVEWESTEPPEAALADELAAARRRPRQRTRLQRGIIVVGLLAIAAVPTVLYLQNRDDGSGSGPGPNERVFSRPGSPFTFHYPKGWREIAARPGAALNKPTYSVELGLDRQDLLAVSTYALRFDVKPDGSAVDRDSGHQIPRVELQRDIDLRMEQIGKAAGMNRVDAPRAGKLGALPARIYHYRGRGASSTFYVAFKDSTQYFVNCLAGTTPDATKEACDLLASTFTPRA